MQLPQRLALRLELRVHRAVDLRKYFQFIWFPPLRGQGGFALQHIYNLMKNIKGQY